MTERRQETVSVRIKEDDYAVVHTIGTRYGAKNVDVLHKLVELWGMIDSEFQDGLFMGFEEDEEPNPVICKSSGNDHLEVKYNK